MTFIWRLTFAVFRCRQVTTTAEYLSLITLLNCNTVRDMLLRLKVIKAMYIISSLIVFFTTLHLWYRG